MLKNMAANSHAFWPFLPMLEAALNTADVGLWCFGLTCFGLMLV